MMKKGLIFMMGCFLNPCLFATTGSVFVSFSMPTNLLEETLAECARLKMPAYLNGLYHDSMRETAYKLIDLSKRIPDLNVQIDPTAFEKFDIHQVPALVVENGNAFDVIYGHLSLEEGLLRIAGRGDSGLNVLDVRRMLGE